MQRASPLLTSAFLLPRVSPAGVRSTWSSEHGPHGPVSPIIQKVVLLVAVDDVDGGVEAGGAEKWAAQ